jgi:peroxiredoxin
MGALVYNYPRFSTAEMEVAGDGGVSPGFSMPDFAVTTLDGKQVRLSEFRGKPVLLETGSLSCPIYCRHIQAMNELATEFTGVEFVVLYVREAHPGANIPAHRNATEKLQRASELAVRLGERRTVCVDDLEGTAHRALGGLPDMLYLMDQAGVVVYRTKWNDVRVARTVVSDFFRDRLLDGIKSHYRIGPPWRVVHALRRAGPDAIVHFLRAYPALLWQEWKGRLPHAHHE